MDFIKLNVPSCNGLAVVVESLRKESLRPVVLETYVDGVVYLGVILDAQDEPWEWVEIRIQETQGIADRLGTAAVSVTNLMLDEKWRRMVAGYAKFERERIFCGPWEKVHGAPCLLTADGRSLSDAAVGWELCIDDALLSRYRLATFSGTAHRYLVDALGTQFIPLSEGAPRSPATKEFDDVFAGLVPINREGGLMMIRRISGMKYDTFVDFLGGKDFGQDLKDLLRIPPVGHYKVFLDRNSHGLAGVGYIHGKSSQAERISETLFLKLGALRGAFGALSNAVLSQRVPFLNLSADSFEVSLVEPAAGLPFLWNHRVSLSASSNVVSLALGVGDEEILMSCEETPRSIYRASRLSAELEGIARVRIRKITPPDDGGMSVIEGTLQTDETLECSRKDLLELNLRLTKGRRFAIYGNLMSQRPVNGEIRFLSLPLKVPDDVMAELERGGVQFAERLDFRVIPRLGATCDLFSMGVLAVRTLLSCGASSLSATLDDLFGLMRAYGATLGAGDWDTGSGRLAVFVASEKGAPWRTKLGPSRLAEGLTIDDAETAIPARLWWQVVEFVGKLFPGEIPGSFSKDYDDFDSRAPERVFADPLEALDSLIEHCRTLLLGNPVASREILTIIRGLSARIRG